MRPLAATFALILLFATLTGCMQVARPVSEPKTLTVACCQPYTYDLQFRDFIEAGFPDWEVKFVPLQADNDYQTYDEKKIAEFMDREKPDLMILNSSDFSLLRKADKLQNLDELASRNKTKLTDNVTPGVLDFLRGEDGGPLYAIGPAFHADAMYFNKDIFDRLDIPYPTDGMTWEQTIALADRVMQDKRREKDEIGLHIPWLRGPFDLLRQIAGTEGLKYADAKTGTVTFDTPGWERLFKQLAAAYKRGTFVATWPEEREENGTTYYDQAAMESVDLFKKGNAAITIDNDNLLFNLKASAKPKFEYGVVTAPARSSDPGIGGEVQLYQLFAIPASSTHAEEAWQMLSFFMSERVGKAKAGLGSGIGGMDLSVQKDYPDWKQDPDYKPFYALRPTNSVYNLYYGAEQGPAGFDESFAELVNGLIRDVAEGKSSADEAFSAIQPQAEALMKKASADRKAAGAEASK